MNHNKKKMNHIGLYLQLTDFSTQHAGTSEWCTAERDGRKYFIKKFHSPVYPSKEIGLPAKMYDSGVAEFKETMKTKEELYDRLRRCSQAGFLVVPREVLNYQFHICTVADFVVGNIPAEKVCLLSEWQRLTLMRTLTLALMGIHEAGVVHSDLKPENVLISQDNEGHCRLRIIDFDGSFFESSPPSDPEEVVGDPSYFAPEAYQQSLDENIRLDHRIDVFALGIIFHYFWCGKLPEKPSNQTIGECLLQEGTISYGESLPLALTQLIKRMLAVNPDDRIELKSVFDVLGIQVQRYSPEFILLKPDDVAENSGKEGKGKVATVAIHYCDLRGNLIKAKTVYVPFGTRKTVKAEEIYGYKINGRSEKEIVVDANGFTYSPVTFSYSAIEEPKRKIPLGAVVFGVAVFLFVIYLIAFYSQAASYTSAGKYAKALQCLNCIPAYKYLFAEDYEYVEDKVHSDDYKNAVSYYKDGYYSEAYSIFSQLPSTYDNTQVYRDFCDAHLYGSYDHYQTLIDNISFADAKELLLADSEIAFRFMEGTWRVYDGGEYIYQFSAEEEEDGLYLTNIPASPDGTWSIRDGNMYITSPDGEEVLFHRITINSYVEMTFQRNSSHHRYSLKRI